MKGTHPGSELCISSKFAADLRDGWIQTQRLTHYGLCVGKLRADTGQPPRTWHTEAHLLQSDLMR